MPMLVAATMPVYGALVCVCGNCKWNVAHEMKSRDSRSAHMWSHMAVVHRSTGGTVVQSTADHSKDDGLFLAAWMIPRKTGNASSGFLINDQR